MSKPGSNFHEGSDDCDSYSAEGDTVTYSDGDITAIVGHSGSKGAASSSYGSIGNPGRETDKQPRPGKNNENISQNASSRTNYYIYCSHFLSAWGDRMWSFGMGLFLVRIADYDLQLPAIYGLTSGMAVFLLGAPIGDWVDSTPRLKAAQRSLISQNLLVVVCAAGVYAYIRWEWAILGQPGGWSAPLCHALVIILAVGADLSSMARVIAVEKDWIVKICGSDTDLLAKMTATLRRIDQTTLILAPVATGQVMTYASLEVGALFIAAWNLASVMLEYYLMWKVYTTVPALAYKDDSKNSSEETPLLKDGEKTAKRTTTTSSSTGAQWRSDIEKTLIIPAPHAQKPPEIQIHPPSSPPPSPDVVFGCPGLLSVPPDDVEECLLVKTTPQLNESSTNYRPDLVGTLVVDTEILLDESEEIPQDGKRGKDCGCCTCHRFSALYEGWRQYKRYTVSLAGLALAFLYMTVLGFDNITVAYAVTQGVSESTLGIMMAVSAVFGMLGTFIYPIWRRRLGLVRTGMLALSCQVSCLSLCVLSIWMPGSPFDPTYSNGQAAAAVTIAMPNGSTGWEPPAQTIWPTREMPLNRSSPDDVTLPFPDSILIVTSPEPSPSAWNTPGLSVSTKPSLFLETTAGDRLITPQSINANPSSKAQLTISQVLKSSSTADNIQTTNSQSASGKSSITVNTQKPSQTKSDNTSLLTTADRVGMTTASDHSLQTTVRDGGLKIFLKEDLMTASSKVQSDFPSDVQGRTEEAEESAAQTSSSSSSSDNSSAAVTSTSPQSGKSSTGPESYVSVSLFLAGIVLARFGLWAADLAITQMFLEAVREGERGAVNGVQSSLNELFNMLKFLLVVFIPDTQSFGFLIVISFLFIFSAWVLYACYLRKVRGHFFPRKLCAGCGDMNYSSL